MPGYTYGSTISSKVIFETANNNYVQIAYDESGSRVKLWVTDTASEHAEGKFRAFALGQDWDSSMPWWLKGNTTETGNNESLKYIFKK